MPLLPRATRTLYQDGTGLPNRTEIGNVTDPADPAGPGFVAAQAVETVYDGNARPIVSKVIGGSTVYAVTQTYYDGLGRPNCTAQRMNLEDFGSALPDQCILTSMSNGRTPDRIVKTLYDAAGQVVQIRIGVGVTGVEAAETTFGYRPNGQVESVVDGRGNRTQYVHDGHDRLERIVYPSTSAPANFNDSDPTSALQTAGAVNPDDDELFAFEPVAGNRTSRLVSSFRNRAEETTVFTYDAHGRTTLKNLPGSELDVSYTYDLLGQMTSASTSAQTLTFGYDALGRNVRQTGASGDYESQYDLAGRRIRIDHPDTFFVTQEYDSTGAMTAIRENGTGLLASFGYDQLGRRTSLTFGNGEKTLYSYDDVSRLRTLTHDLGGAGPSPNDNTITFTYNPAGQIVKREATNSAYDWTGHGNGRTDYTVDGLNRLASQTTGPTVTSFTHDTRGDRLNDDNRTYGYDSETKGRGSPTAPWHYDPLGRLSGASTNATAPPAIAYESYVDNLVAERTPGSSTVQRRHVFGPGGDEPLVWYEGSSRRFLHADERGSVVAVTSDSGGLLAINRYDEYGRTETTSTTYMGRFLYTGQRYFGGFGVYHYKNRIYDPRTGRFMQPDPIGLGGGMNLYVYVGGDPVNATDSLGLTPRKLDCTGTRLCSYRDGSGGGISGSVQVFGDVNGFRSGNSSGGSVDVVEVNIYDINDLANPINTWFEFRMNGSTLGSMSTESFSQHRCAGGSACPDSSPEGRRRYSETLRAMFRTPAVFRQMARAWQASNPYGDKGSKNEHGFWVFDAYGQYAPGRLLSGKGDAVWGFDYRPIGANIFFHTHPFTTADRYVPWLSGKDHGLAKEYGVMIVAYSHAGFMEADYRRGR